MTMAAFTFQCATFSSRSASSYSRPVTMFTIRRARSLSFSEPVLYVNHQVAVRLAGPNHRAGREHIEHELRRGAGLQSRRAGNHLGADTRSDGQIDERLQLGA